MHKNCGSLPTVQRVRHVCRAIRVGIAHSVYAGYTSNQTLGHVDFNFPVLELDPELLAQARCLNGWKVGEEDGPLDGLAGCEFNTEEVMVGIGRKTRILGAVVVVTESNEPADRTVVDFDLVEVEIGFPVWLALIRLRPDLLRISAVDKSDYVTVQRDSLAQHFRNLVQGTEKSHGLVGGFITIAPRTPINAFTPRFRDARGIGNNIAHPRGEDNLAGQEGFLSAFGEIRINAEERVVRPALLREDSKNSSVHHCCGFVVK